MFLSTYSAKYVIRILSFFVYIFMSLFSNHTPVHLLYLDDLLSNSSITYFWGHFTIYLYKPNSMTDKSVYQPISHPSTMSLSICRRLYESIRTHPPHIYIYMRTRTQNKYALTDRETNTHGHSISRNIHMNSHTRTHTHTHTHTHIYIYIYIKKDMSQPT